MIVLIIDDKMDMLIVLCLEGRYAGIKDDTHSRYQSSLSTAITANY